MRLFLLKPLLTRSSYVQVKYHVSALVASLTIATYVFGCMCTFSRSEQRETKLTHGLPDGLGALVFSPLSEVEYIGRNIPHAGSLVCFVVLSAATAACDQFTGIVMLRLAQGVFGSPALATGAASMQDMVSRLKDTCIHEIHG